MLNARILGLGLVVLAAGPYGYWLLAGSKMALFCSCMLLLFGLAACVRIRANPDSLRGKHILVTGCDTGIGLALCQRLARLGAVVYAGCLRAEAEGPVALAREWPETVHLVQLNVTSDAEVSAAFSRIDESLVGSGAFLWAVVNNAGIQYSGDLELTTMSQARQVMEVNYFGLLRVTKAFLPLLREKPGRLINVSSIRGRCVWPLTGAYTASKFAVEALSDSLRLELARFGVPVVLAEPSHFGGATGMLADEARIGAEFDAQWSAAEDHVQEAYGREYVDAVRSAVLSGAKTSYPSVEPIIVDLVEALASDAPRDRYLTGGTNNAWLDEYKVQAVLRDWLPASLHDLLVERQALAGLPLPRLAAMRAARVHRGWFQ